ncbi:MAG TPA: 3-oxoacyl-[acyl-carrier-protein] reductase [Ktedonobacterales bacterium]|nr:3-oxoacyl-[acyl-carrier-protein] reductase [Ktedonobacterales bacterium]
MGEAQAGGQESARQGGQDGQDAGGLPLAGRVALVTGSSRGIGQATAQRLAALGADVAVSYRSDVAGANATRERITALGRRAIAVQGDVSVEEDVARVFKEIEAQLGGVAILVNNAGTTNDRLILQMKLEDFEGLLKANLTSAFLCVRAAVRSMMRARWGRIVNVASISGMMGQVGQANYAASKAGLIALTKSVAREFASRNITCNAVAPGYIPTELTANVSQEFRDYYMNITPLKRYGTAEEVAAAIAFLCGPEAGYITGQTLAVDGGISMH